MVKKKKNNIFLKKIKPIQKKRKAAEEKKNVVTCGFHVQKKLVMKVNGKLPAVDFTEERE
jgi:hypothetical protein